MRCWLHVAILTIFGGLPLVAEPDAGAPLLDATARAALAAASGTERPVDPYATIPLRPAVLLPDGTPYMTWERPQTWRRTYYVNARHPLASDANPGSEDRPFATINHAAQILEPGERVIVEAGVYRETIRPRRGGSGPDRMIGYMARPGAEVVVSGAEPLTGEWRPVTVEGFPESAKRAVRVIELPDRLCGVDSPVAALNLSPYAIDRFLPKGKFQDNNLRSVLLSSPAMLFQDGRRLKQAVSLTAAGNFQTTPCLDTAGPGHFHVDAASRKLYVWPYDNANPDRVNWQLTTRRQLFVPDVPGLGFLMVKGFRFEYAGNTLPMPHFGMVSTRAGHHWLIEDNHIREANGIGLDLGRRHWTEEPPPLMGSHIVRGNLIEQCGVAGIAATGVTRYRFQLLVEDNTIRECAYLPAAAMHESSAFKAHFLYGSLIRNNRILHIRHGSAIWLDNRTGNNRITGNVIADIHTGTGAVFVELGDLPNLVDTNILVDIHGDGIYSHDAGGVLAVHNLLANIHGNPLLLRGSIGPRSKGMRIGFHQVRNNLLVNSGDDVEVSGDGVVVVNNQQMRGRVRLDPETLRLHWPMSARVDPAPRLPMIDGDERVLVGEGRLMGPFSRQPEHIIDLYPAR